MIVIVFGLLGFFVMLFLICAVVFPESVGIGGSLARKIEESHKDQKEADDPHAPHK